MISKLLLHIHVGLDMQQLQIYMHVHLGTYIHNTDHSFDVHTSQMGFNN